MEDFLTSTGKYYQASLERLDFADGEAASQVINTWVADQTNQKIKDLILPGILTPNTVMVLVNAIYFKGRIQFLIAKSVMALLTFIALWAVQSSAQTRIYSAILVIEYPTMPHTIKFIRVFS